MTDPNKIIIAFLGGLIPALLWLWFWLKEDKEHPEPRGLIFISFVLGMLAVILVLPLEKFASTQIGDRDVLIVVWAALEEILKYGAVALIALKSSYLDEPIDYPIYFMTAALGFAAFENAIFLIHPIAVDNAVVSLLTGSLRFMGATLLHAISSGIVGIALGLAFYRSRFIKVIYGLFGLASAIALHSVFNFFIIKDEGQNFLTTFGFLWVVAIIIMLLFEKLRRMSKIS